MPTPDEPDADTAEPVARAGASDAAHPSRVSGADAGGEDAQAQLRVELDERLIDLDGLSARPLHEHVEVYQRMHLGLQAALAEIDSA